MSSRGEMRALSRNCLKSSRRARRGGKGVGRAGKMAKKLENAHEPGLADRLFEVLKDLPLDLQEDCTFRNFLTIDRRKRR